MVTLGNRRTLSASRVGQNHNSVFTLQVYGTVVSNGGEEAFEALLKVLANTFWSRSDFRSQQPFAYRAIVRKIY